MSEQLKLEEQLRADVKVRNLKDLTHTHTQVESEKKLIKVAFDMRSRQL